MKRVMTIYGTRPEAIKLAPLIQAMREAKTLVPVVTLTGQHQEMTGQVNDLFGIRSDYDLGSLRLGTSLAANIATVLRALSALLDEDLPDAIVVQGDTWSALTGAMAGFYSQIPVFHVEAGLRTGLLREPFPEEGQRRLITSISSLHLAPTPGAKQNLLGEGVDPNNVVVTGNTVIDALQMAARRATTFADKRIEVMLSSGRPMLLVTMHRRDSWGVPMRAALTALRDVLIRHPEVWILLPVHRNPLVADVVDEVLGDHSGVLLTDPLDYGEFCRAMQGAAIVITDSGGVQEEAPSLGKPVLVLRDTTERPEGVATGTVKLIGTQRGGVRDAITHLIEAPEARRAMSTPVNPYGDGRAAVRCVAAIEAFFAVGRRPADFEPREWAAGRSL